jgi:hypothetical protein
MADRSSWTLPGNGILGGVALGSGPSGPDDPNLEYETPWARALREAIERLPDGDAVRPAMLAGQVRLGAIQTGPVDPLARPAAALIDWLRQPPAPPAMTTKSDRSPQPTMLQHELVARGSGGNIGKAIIDHYADYLDPWAKDEQGRYIVETPAWTTPNAAGKTPSAQKPWWWPIVGGIDLGSNFVGLGAGVKGATVGGRAAFAASKAAAAEAGPTGKLLNAIREGQLAKLADESAGANAEALASRSVRLYNPPAKPLRPFEADYPRGAATNAEGRLLEDIEGRPLAAGYVVGRRTLGGVDEALSPTELNSAGTAILGTVPQAVAAHSLPRRAVGAFSVTRGPDGPERRIAILRSLNAANRDKVIAHEVGHAIDDLSSLIATKELTKELRHVYNDLNNADLVAARARRPDVNPSERRVYRNYGPEQQDYSGADVDRELIAEAIRAYATDPNYLKTVAPQTAAAIRAAANANPRISRVLQFNTLAAGAGGMSLSDLGFGGAADHSSQQRDEP